MNQRRLDQLIVQSRRRHKAKMERLRKNFLGKRAEDGSNTNRERDDYRGDGGGEEREITGGVQ